jgi:hypothetical protein
LVYKPVTFNSFFRNAVNVKPAQLIQEHRKWISCRTLRTCSNYAAVIRQNCLRFLYPCLIKSTAAVLP